TLAISIAIVIGYTRGSDLGWNTTHTVIQEELGSESTSEHFDIFYDARSFLPGQIERLTSEMEYRYASISERLDEQVGARILVYLYPTAALKGSLTGSRYTSVTPVWLADPQIHMLASRIDGSFDHELVHVFSREFGMPIVKASPSVGLVEGLASAVEAPDGGPSPRDLMAATLADGDADSTEVVDQLVSGLGAFGFWTGRGPVSYSASGSFVDFLLRAYGAERFKRVYRDGDFSDAYGRSVEELAGEWFSDLRAAEFISAAARPAARRLFALPSLFEMECPHALAEHIRLHRQANDHFAVHDTAAAIEALRRAIDVEPDYLAGAVALSTAYLREGRLGEAEAFLPRDSTYRSHPIIAVLTGDLAALAGDNEAAHNMYSAVLDSLPSFYDEARAIVLLRRHVADNPAAMRFLVTVTRSADPTGASIPSTVKMLGNERRRQYGDACDAGLAPPHYLEDEFSNEQAAMLRRLHSFWLGEVCEVAGRHEDAQTAYDAAADAFRGVGQIDLLRLATDRIERVRWKHSNDQVEQTRETSQPTPSDRVEA
ncbi:MAG: hypothetical protein R3282_09365, partial [Rhodothermales bacterium]|nr:hypothetical protein [Rhodothermales bacterium]